MTKFIIKKELSGIEIFNLIEKLKQDSGSRTLSPLFYVLKAKEKRHLFYISSCRSKKGNRELRNPRWLADRFNLNEKFYEVMELDWIGKLSPEYIRDNRNILPIFPQSDSEIPLISEEKYKELESLIK